MKENSTILITGAAGFIGFHSSLFFLERGYTVLGYDCLNAYYDVKLKESRLEKLSEYDNFIFVKGFLEKKDELEALFLNYKIEYVINLAAQAGVRYSIDFPESYINSNIIGFFNLLELCRKYKPKHLVYASSSSVYGANKKTPFSVEDKTDCPVSLYAATKKSNELLAYSYSSLYDIPMTGLRFFTVYGPYGRPDMAYFKFTERIMNGLPIQIYNEGDLYRDFTYIDDIVHALSKIIEHPPIEDENQVKHKVYNIGNNSPVKIADFVHILEKSIGIEARCEYLPMQPGDVYQTYADIDELYQDFGVKPRTTIEIGLRNFVQWYKAFYDTKRGEGNV